MGSLYVRGSLTDRTIDGWFTHLNFVFMSGDHAVSCTSIGAASRPCRARIFS